MTDKTLTAAEVTALIAAEPALAVYFSSTACNVCHALFPRIEQMMAESYPRFRLLRVRVDDAPEVAAQMGVLSVPTLLIYLDHHEAQRYVRQLSVEALRRDLERPYQLLFD